MMRKTFALICLILAITACSTQKNTRFRRAYHNLNAHFNALFNGRESLKAGELKIAEGTRNDYAHVLPMFEYSNKENTSVATSDMERAVSKGTILIAKHSITKKPLKKPTDSDPYYRKFYNQKEFNKWVDEAWMLIGKGKFYQHDFSQAIQTFDIVIRDFTHTKTIYEALLWKAAAFSEKGDYASARMALETYDSWGAAPQSLYAHYMAVYGDLLMKQGKYEAAIPYVRNAANSARNKHTKLRYRYILAQLLAMNGKDDQADDEFHKVLKLRPPYEMAINAKIERASLSGVNEDANLRQLKQLARDKKNGEYLDRIYYAMALINLQKEDQNSALENLTLSSQLSKNNDQQKGLSFLLAGDIYFNRPEYKPAYMAYDSAMFYLPETDELRTALVNKHASLQDLVHNLTVVEIEDSLQAIAHMPESERMALIDKIIAEEQKRLKEEDERRQNEFLGNNMMMNSSISTLATSGQGSKWYFYNPSTMTLGKAEFERKWGKRKLEDNWRRSNKSAVMPDEMPDMEDAFGEKGINGGRGQSDLSAKEDNATQKQFTREGLMKDVPMTAEAIQQSNERTEDALLAVGKIYNEKLNDYPRAIDTYEELLRRFPNGKLRQEAYIDLFSAYRNAGNTAGMNSVKDRLGKEFPQSKFYAYLSDSRFFEKTEEAIHQQDMEYQKTYSDYLSNEFSNVISKSVEVENQQTDNPLISKYRLIKALSFARQGDAENFKMSLQTIVDKHAGTDEAVLAQALLDELSKGRMPVKGPVKPITDLAGSVQNANNSPEHTHIDAVEGYVMDPNVLHNLVIWVNRATNTKQLIYNVADYNFSYFLVKDYDIELLTLPDQSKLLVVKGFGNKQQAMDYLYAMRQNGKIFRQIDDAFPRLMVVSVPNFKFMLSNGDVMGYLPFYLPNYLNVTLSNDELLDYQVVTGYLRPTSEINTSDNDEQSTSYIADGVNWQFALMFDAAGVNLSRLQSAFVNFNTSKRMNSLKISMRDMPNGQKVMVVSGHSSKVAAQKYLDMVSSNRMTYQEVQSKNYRMLVITPENLSILTKTEDLDGYLKFFSTLP